MAVTVKIAPCFEANDELRGFVEHLPEAFRTQGSVVYSDRNVIKRFDVAGRVLVVKRFKRPNLVQKVAYSFFCKGKARRAFEHGLELLRRGIDTPQPVAYLELKRAGLLYDSFYVSLWDGHQPIVKLIDGQADFDRQLVRDFALFAARLHRLGILHHDLNSTNTLYERQADGHYTFSVIDINRMDFYDGLPPLKECLENITRFTGNMQLFGYFLWFYADTLAADFSMTSAQLTETAMKQKHKHDDSYARRKRVLRRLRRMLPKF